MTELARSTRGSLPTPLDPDDRRGASSPPHPTAPSSSSAASCAITTRARRARSCCSSTRRIRTPNACCATSASASPRESGLAIAAEHRIGSLARRRPRPGRRRRRPAPLRRLRRLRPPRRRAQGVRPHLEAPALGRRHDGVGRALDGYRSGTSRQSRFSKRIFSPVSTSGRRNSDTSSPVPSTSRFTQLVSVSIVTTGYPSLDVKKRPSPSSHRPGIESSVPK